MATIDHPTAVNRERLAVYMLLGLVGASVLAVLIGLLSRPPQMGPDADVFRTVDALYTAVRSKDEKQLAECEARLHAYREAGKLPASPAGFLNGVIDKARAGKWEVAAETLYEFMLAQRRDGAGAGEPREPKREPKAKPAKAKS